ncbi:MAG: FecR domain-containing protein [Spirochaetia bacterium]|jgi:hypothetical protein
MKARRSLLILASLILVTAYPALAQDKIGDTVYLEGGVSLERGGQQLDQSEVQTGLAIENFDIVRTGPDGLAEVTIDNPKAPAMTVKVSPRTQFSFELSRLESRQQTSVGLSGGTISLKVGKLTGTQDLNVVLDNAVMGVRGTEFSVTSTPSGDLLVLCTTGDVVLTDENGKEVHAIPGTAIEKLAGGRFNTVTVGSADPGDFRNKWEDARIAALKANALEVIQREVQSYDRLQDEFTEEYAALQEKREILARWETEEKNGTIPAGADVGKEKAEIADILADLRETQFLLQRAHFRLLGLKELHDQGFGDGDLGRGLTANAFFVRFEKDRAELEREMASVRAAVRLLVHRNNGHDPTVVVDLKKFRERRLAHLRRLEHRRLVKKPA